MQVNKELKIIALSLLEMRGNPYSLESAEKCRLPFGSKQVEEIMAWVVIHDHDGKYRFIKRRGTPNGEIETEMLHALANLIVCNINNQVHVSCYDIEEICGRPIWGYPRYLSEKVKCHMPIDMVKARKVALEVSLGLNLDSEHSGVHWN